MVTTQQISWREFLVEFLFSYTLVLIAVLAIFRAPSAIVHIITAGAFGLLFTIMRKRMIAFGNPVMSLALLSLRKISPKLGLALISFQLAAGVLAGLTVRGLVENIGNRLEGFSGFTKLSFAGAFGEFMGAFLLVAGLSALMAMYHRPNSEEGSSVINVFFVAYASMLLSALLGSMGLVNPAIAFAVGLHFNIVYTIVPLVGGLLGALFYTTIIEGRALAWSFGRPRPVISQE